MSVSSAWPEVRSSELAADALWRTESWGPIAARVRAERMAESRAVRTEQREA